MGEYRETDSKRMALIISLVCLGPIALAVLCAVQDDSVRQAMLDALPLMWRYGITLVLPVLAAWAAMRLFGSAISAPTFALVANLAAFVIFAGIAQSAALALVVAAAIVIGAPGPIGTRVAASSPATVALAGLGLMVGVVGWLLPLPLHGAATYIAILGLVALLGWARLLASARVASAQWQAIAAGHPIIATFAICIVGFAAVLTWLPSMNPDDNAVHLLLGKQLLLDSYYRIDVSSQVFAAAPWFNDVFHGVLVVLSGADARQSIGLAWLLIGAAGAFRLARILGADSSYAWLAVALYASYPLTSYFGMTLQVDGASAACLLHLAACCVAMQKSEEIPDSPWVMGILCGIAAGLKVTNCVYLAAFGAWIIWMHVRRHQLSKLAVLMAIAAVVAASSYVYAWLITGNPLFPLFNGFFESPYMPAVNFGDPRWHHGVAWTVLWDVTFSTGDFMEAYPGAAGLVLLGLLGAWAMALFRGGVGALVASIAIVAGAIVFLQVQYVRYVFPAIALLIVVAVVAIGEGRFRRTGAAAILLLAIFQCALVMTTSWILMGGVAKQLLVEGPSALRDIERKYVPEKVLIENADLEDSACLLFADPVTAYVALAPGKSLTTAFYDPRMHQLAAWASEDDTGERWTIALDRVGITHVELRPGLASAGLLEALSKLGFKREQRLGEAELWSRTGPAPNDCQVEVIKPRNQAKRLMSLQ